MKSISSRDQSVSQETFLCRASLVWIPFTEAPLLLSVEEHLFAE